MNICRFHLIRFSVTVSLSLRVCLIMICLLDGLSQRDSKHKEEVAALQKSISALDREKDALLDEVDHKTEKLVVLQTELSSKVLSSRLLTPVIILHVNTVYAYAYVCANMHS